MAEQLDSKYSVLKRLEGSPVNVDELDYLSKRLESFWRDEPLKFQSLTEK